MKTKSSLIIQRDHSLAKYIAEEYLNPITPLTAHQLAMLVNLRRSVVCEAIGYESIPNLTPSCIRNLINIIRREGYGDASVLSNQQGYFFSTEKDDIINYIERWELRLQSQKEAIIGLRKQLKTIEKNKEELL